MMKRIVLPFLFMLPASVHAADTGFFAATDNFYDIEPVYSSSFGKDWHSPFFGGNTAIALEKTEYGAKYGRFELAWTQRNYSWFTFGTESAELVHSVVNESALRAGSFYTVNVDAKKYVLEGARLQVMAIENSNVILSVGATYYQGVSLLEGTLRGRVVAKSPTEYEFSNVLLDYVYERDELFENTAHSPTGHGVAYRLFFRWNIDPTVKLSLEMDDLFGYIRWQNVPFTTARLDSDTKTYDASGYVKFQPTLTGRQGVREYGQELYTVTRLVMESDIGNGFSANSELFVTPIKWFPLMGIAKEVFGSRYRVGFIVNPQDKVAVLRFISPLLTVEVGSGNVDISKSRSVTLNAALRYGF